MRRISTPLAALVAGLIALAAHTVRAQDAAAVNPKTIHVTLDNDRVRVFEAKLEPGDKENLHSHPASIVYVIAGGRVRSHTPDGKTSEAEMKAGDTVYREPLTHWAENIGTTTLRLIVVELKTPR